MAEQTTIVTSADVIARLSTQAYTRLFAKNGGSTVDTAFRDLCIAEANSEIRSLTGAAFPDGLYLTTDVIDPIVIRHGFNLVCAHAASAHMSSDESTAYAANGRLARQYFKDVNRALDAQPAGSSNTPRKPRAQVTNMTDTAGDPTDPYNRAASGVDTTGF